MKHGFEFWLRYEYLRWFGIIMADQWVFHQQWPSDSTTFQSRWIRTVPCQKRSDSSIISNGFDIDGEWLSIDNSHVLEEIFGRSGMKSESIPYIVVDANNLLRIVFFTFLVPALSRYCPLYGKKFCSKISI